MNVEHVERLLSGYEKPVHWGLWGMLLLASVAVGCHAGKAFTAFTFWETYHDTRRACPEGWSGVAIGLGLLVSGVFLGRKWRAYAAALLCGFGCGFIVWPTFLIWWYKVAPSC